MSKQERSLLYLLLNKCEDIMDMKTYLLCLSVRKNVDAHCTGKRHIDYFDKATLLSKLANNGIYYQELFYKDEYGVEHDSYVLVKVMPGDLEERMRDLVNKSILKVMMEPLKDHLK